MKFRTRLVVAASVAVALAVLTASLVAFVASRSAVVSSVDDQLNANAAKARAIAYSGGELDSDSALGNVLQVVLPDGTVVVPGYPYQMPVTAAVRHVAATQGGSYFSDVSVAGTEWRQLVVPVPPGALVRGTVYAATLPYPGGAIQLAYPLTGVNSQLRRLGAELLLAVIFGVLLAIALGWLVGQTALVPLHELTGSVEEVAETTDVSRRLEPGEMDELGRLRRAFNRLLAALEKSQESQRQLVLDASHELRTPLTSLRTNLEVVRRLDELPPADREVLVADVLAQLEELTVLVGDLSELARGDHAEQARSIIRLDRLVEDAAAIAGTHGRTRGIEVRTFTVPTWVNGRSDRLGRAVGNLIDNALKWSPEGSTVEVHCAAGEVTVQDHGPGIAPEDLPHIFDRFYRSPAARSLPGSGLGLAIVAQVAEAEGGTVTATNGPGGGALFRFRLPTVSPPTNGHGDGLRDDV